MLGISPKNAGFSPPKISFLMFQRKQGAMRARNIAQRLKLLLCMSKVLDLSPSTRKKKKERDVE